MKFSKAKKAKMKKIRQRRNSEIYKDPIGMGISQLTYDSNVEIKTFDDYEKLAHYTVADATRVNGDIYLLAKLDGDDAVQVFLDGRFCWLSTDETKTREMAIFKIVRRGEFVKLSPKRLFEMKKVFEAAKNWSEKSNIVISEEGIITC